MADPGHADAADPAGGPGAGSGYGAGPAPGPGPPLRRRAARGCAGGPGAAPGAGAGPGDAPGLRRRAASGRPAVRAARALGPRRARAAPGRAADDGRPDADVPRTWAATCSTRRRSGPPASAPSAPATVSKSADAPLAEEPRCGAFHASRRTD